MNSKFVDGGSCVEDECQLEQKLKFLSVKNVAIDGVKFKYFGSIWMTLV